MGQPVKIELTNNCQQAIAPRKVSKVIHVNISTRGKCLVLRLNKESNSAVTF